jgi:2-polyprenyl-3-methyl-5-hydroxy-6-metoxy-1,4-benzoquinol methylase
MKVSTNFFGRQFQKHYPLKKGDIVMDYGCGPGLLIDSLVALNANVVGVDINEFFLDQNRRKYPGTEFIQVSEDPDTTVRILSEKLRGAKFDYVILLSIVQYFKSHSDIETILKFLSTQLQPHGSIIIADVLDENTSSTRDALGIFKECVRRGQAIAFVRFIIYLMFSDYKSISKNNQLLKVPEEVAKGIAVRSNLSLKKVSGLTPHPTRTSYVFTHSN